MRTLGSELTTAIAQENSNVVHLLEVNHSGGVLRITDAPEDIAALSETWAGIGGVFELGEVSETEDPLGQSVSLKLAAVDQTIIALILGNDVRGREARLWLAHLKADGQVADAPLELYRGFLNDAWSIREVHGEGIAPGSVTVETKVRSRLSALKRVRAVRSNPSSHREMLVRAGFTLGALDDSLFSKVGELVGREVMWGVNE